MLQPNFQRSILLHRTRIQNIRAKKHHQQNCRNGGLKMTVCFNNKCKHFEIDEGYKTVGHCTHKETIAINSEGECMQLDYEVE